MKKYIHQFRSKRFLKASFLNFKSSIICAPESGAYCNLGFFDVFYYTGDKEPDVKTIKSTSKKFIKLIVWDRLESKTKPSGWLTVRIAGKRPTLGVCDILNDSYFEVWSETARRYRRKYYGDETLKVVPLTKEEYLNAYKNSTLSKNLQDLFSGTINNFQKVYQEDFSCIGIVDDVGNILTALAFVCDADIEQSVHLSSFMNRGTYKNYVGVGLIDEWIKQVKSKGISFVNFGVMYEKGDPKSWIGYTNFKEHFKPFRVRHELPLLKIIIG